MSLESRLQRQFYILFTLHFFPGDFKEINRTWDILLTGARLLVGLCCPVLGTCISILCKKKYLYPWNFIILVM